jgi:tripartite-type tricarboxylate transporter receptor subunit TctC
LSKIRTPKTPAPILTRLHEAKVAALALPDVRDRLREEGAEVVGNSSSEFAAYVAAEIPKWAALAGQAGRAILVRQQQELKRRSASAPARS